LSAKQANNFRSGVTFYRNRLLTGEDQKNEDENEENWGMKVTPAATAF
jgi:hypothetical protein